LTESGSPYSAAVEVKSTDYVIFGYYNRKAQKSLKAPAPPPLFDQNVLKALRGMFGSSRNYDFLLHTQFTITSSGGGSMGDVSPIDPSHSTYGEWTALAALFDEVKAVSTYVEIMGYTSPASLAPALPVSFALAMDEQNDNTAASSYSATYRLAGSNTFVLPYGDNGSGRHYQFHKFATRWWCNTATPASASPVAGMVGCWTLYNGNVGTAGTNYGLFNQVVRARFRCRA
jgi:hypothetical protein